MNTTGNIDDIKVDAEVLKSCSSSVATFFISKSTLYSIVLSFIKYELSKSVWYYHKIPQDKEDISQDLHIKSFEVYNKFVNKPENRITAYNDNDYQTLKDELLGNLKKYLFMALNNYIADIKRKEKRRRKRIKTISINDYDDIIDKKRYEEMRDYDFSCLSKLQKNIIIYKLFNYSNKDIAENLGVHHKTIDYQLKNIREVFMKYVNYK